MSLGGVAKAHKKVKFIKLDNKYEKQNYITGRFK